MNLFIDRHPPYAGLVLPFLSFLSSNSLLGRDGKNSSVETAALHTKEQDVILACLSPSLPFPSFLKGKAFDRLPTSNVTAHNMCNLSLAFEFPFCWSAWVQAFDSLPILKYEISG